MRVDTPSTGDDLLAEGPEEDQLQAAVAAAESVLADRFGAPITLTDPEDLAGSGPAVVVRVRVASSPFSLPKTLVVKHYRRQSAFATEAASYQLFTALTSEERMCPEPIGHDKTRGVLVLSDLGLAPTLEDKLHQRDARAAERALLSWSRALGRVHATTARREADFNALLRRLGGTPSCDDEAQAAVAAQLPAGLQDVLGVSTSDTVREQVSAALARVQAATFRAFSPVDLSPENNLVTSSGVRFLDFEHGQVRNALLDVAHMRVPFAFWQGALALPAGMSEAMIAGWRAEVVSVWPRLADESVFSEALLDCQLMCVWQQTHRELPGLAASVNGAQASSRPAALVSWWQELSKQGAFAGADDLADHAGAVAAGLDERFGPGLEFAPYPAFA